MVHLTLLIAQTKKNSVHTWRDPVLQLLFRAMHMPRWSFILKSQCIVRFQARLKMVLGQVRLTSRTLNSLILLQAKTRREVFWEIKWSNFFQNHQILSPCKTLKISLSKIVRVMHLHTSSNHQRSGLTWLIAVTFLVLVQKIQSSLSATLKDWHGKELKENWKISHWFLGLKVIVTTSQIAQLLNQSMVIFAQIMTLVFLFGRVKTQIQSIDQSSQSISTTMRMRPSKTNSTVTWTTTVIPSTTASRESQDSQVWYMLHKTIQWNTKLSWPEPHQRKWDGDLIPRIQNMEFMSWSNSPVPWQEPLSLMVRKFHTISGKQAQQLLVKVNMVQSLDHSVVKTDMLLFKTSLNSSLVENVRSK